MQFEIAPIRDQRSPSYVFRNIDFAKDLTFPDNSKTMPDNNSLATQSRDNSSDTSATGARWTFLTNHSHVLVLLHRNPNMILRDVAQEVGITERAVQRIIAELEDAGIIERTKVGRQNQYSIRPNQPLRHSIESHRTIADMLNLFNPND